MNRIEQLAGHVGRRTTALITEAQEKITEAINVATEQLEEGKELVLTLPIQCKWSPDSNKVEVSVSVNVKHKFTSEASLPDPDQPELMDRDGDPLPESVAKPLRNLRSAIGKGGATIEEIRNEGGRG